MWLMLQQDQPDDFVIASGETWSVRQFVEMAFAVTGVALDWVGEGVHERGVCRVTGKTRVLVDPRYFRPTEVNLLWGDASKAQARLGWKATTPLKELVRIMVEYDLKHEGYGWSDQ